MCLAAYLTCGELHLEEFQILGAELAGRRLRVSLPQNDKVMVDVPH